MINKIKGEALLEEALVVILLRKREKIVMSHQIDHPAIHSVETQQINFVSQINHQLP